MTFSSRQAGDDQLLGLAGRGRNYGDSLIAPGGRPRHDRRMNWKSIRLELARTPEFPEGSASRAFLLHLPLDQDGLIDEEVLRDAPARATVHRFWPNER